MERPKQTHKQLSRAISALSQHLSSWTQEVQQGVTTLKRVNDHGPNVGAYEFKHALSELDEEVSELAQQSQNLERFTVDSISMEELLGHCSQLYQSNRTGMQKLETHLAQYGYQSPGSFQQPADPLSLVDSAPSPSRDQAFDLRLDSEDDEALLQPPATINARQQAHAPSTAGHTGRNTRARARQQTPGVQLKGLPASDDEAEENMDDAEFPFKDQLAGVTAPGTSKATKKALTKPDVGRHSLASSDTTPEAFMSPSLAALQAKYAADGQGVQDEAKLTPARSASRTGRASVQSSIPKHEPRTTRSGSTPVQQPPPESKAMSPVPADDDTCNLYQQLIRSKDVPSSVTTALSNSTRSSSHRKSNSNSNAAAGSGNGAAGNGNNASAAGNANNTAAIGSASNSRVQAMAAAAAAAKASTPPAANAQQPTAQQTNASAANAQQPNAVNATQPPQHMRSPSEAMAAARNQPLADKLASLESMWVTSGQAARSPTPRRAAQEKSHPWDDDAEGGSRMLPEVTREAQAMALRLSADLSIPVSASKATRSSSKLSRSHSAARPQSSSIPAAPAPSTNGEPSNGEFQFAPIQPAPTTGSAAVVQGRDRSGSIPDHPSPAWPSQLSAVNNSSTNSVEPGSSHAGTAQPPPHSAAHSNGSTHSTHITPADASLLSKYNTVTPGSMGGNLSPGTASLLSRVYGTAGPSHSRPVSAADSALKNTPGKAVPQSRGTAAKAQPQQQPSALKDQQTTTTTAHTQQPPTSPAPARSPRAVPASSAQPKQQPTPAAAPPLSPRDVSASDLASHPLPPLEQVGAALYEGLPMFLRSQLPLVQMNKAIQGVVQLLQQQGHDGQTVTMDELKGLDGMDGQKSKVFVNILVKLGRVRMMGASKFSCIPSPSA